MSFTRTGTPWERGCSGRFCLSTGDGPVGRALTESAHHPAADASSTLAGLTICRLVGLMPAVLMKQK
jgi:hypothetical protein